MLSAGRTGTGKPRRPHAGVSNSHKDNRQQMGQSEWMKNYQRRATLAAAQACAKEVNAASAVARAIACSSMEIGRPFDKKNRGAGRARVRSNAIGNWFAQILG